MLLPLMLRVTAAIGASLPLPLAGWHGRGGVERDIPRQVGLLGTSCWRDTHCHVVTLTPLQVLTYFGMRLI